MANEYEMLFSLNAQLGSSFNSTFSTASSTLSSTQSKIAELAKVQSDINAYEKQQTAVEATTRKLTDLQKEYDNIQREIDETGEFSSTLENKLIQKQAAIDKTSASLQNQTEKLNGMKEGLESAGISTDNLSEESKKLSDEMDRLAEENVKAKQESENFGSAGSASFASVGEAIVAAGIAAKLAEITSQMAEMIKQSGEYADSINTMSIQYGIAKEDLQAYGYAAELVDTSVEDITRAQTKNIRAMNTARDGAGDAAEKYKELGISIVDGTGQLRDSETVFWEVIDALGSMNNETERDAAALSILGKSAMQLNPLIEAGSETMRQYADEAKAAGYVLSDEMLASLGKMDDATRIQENNIKALKNQISAQFAPAATEVLTILNSVLKDVTNFAKENPALTKTVVGLATALAGIVAVYTGYVAIKKTANIVKALSATLTAKETANEGMHTSATLTQTLATEGATVAQGALNAVMSANPILLVVGALGLLIGSMIDFTGEANVAADAASSMSDEVQNLIDSTNQSASDFDRTISSIDSEEASVNSLIDRMAELQSKTSLTSAEQTELKGIIDQLNESIDGLNLSADNVNSADYVRKVADAMYERQKFEEAMKTYSTSKSNSDNIDKQVAEAKKKWEEALKYASENFNDPKNDYVYNLAVRPMEFLSGEYGAGYDSAWGAVDTAKAAYDELLAAQEENNRSLEESESIIDSYTASVDGEDTKIVQLTSTLTDLSEQYKAAYDSAYDSITGQYELWDTAAVVVPTDIDTINTSLETQKSYWSDYNTDMTNLLGRTGDIEGLSDVIASFADGSEESVNAIAGMANATDEDLKKMVENFNAVKKMQEDTSSSVAEMKTGFTDEVKSAIGDLDLSDEAQKNGQSTIDAYIEAIKAGGVDAITETQTLVAQLDQIWEDSKPNRLLIHSRSKGYADGTNNAERGWHLVGENGPELAYFGGGERVINADNTLRLLDDYQSSTGNITVAPSITIQGSADSGTVESIKDAVVESVLMALEEADLDARRSVYA